MRPYFIHYRLHGTQDYKKFYASIKALSLNESDQHPLHQSVWLICSRTAPEAIRDTLKAHLDPKDELLVMGVTHAWSEHDLDQKTKEWLTEHIGSAS